MVTVSVLGQPLVDGDETIYDVVLTGLAVGLEQLLQDRPRVGVHVYVNPPEARRLVELPWQIVSLLETFNALSISTVKVSYVGKEKLQVSLIA